MIAQIRLGVMCLPDICTGKNRGRKIKMENNAVRLRDKMAPASPINSKPCHPLKLRSFIQNAVGIMARAP